MTRLEKAINKITGGAKIKAWEMIIAAATIDLAEAEQRGYRQGVEDGERLHDIRIGNAYLEKAKHNKNWWIQCCAHMVEAQVWWDKAFRGARNVARVEIRQRLEALKNG